MSSPRLIRVAAVLTLLGVTLLPACAHQTIRIPVSATNGAAGGVAPQLAVESFLRAANCVAAVRCATKARDIDSMARLFGTRDGSILDRDPRADVEQRMYALASLLQSDDYSVQGQNIVPGRVGEALQLTVSMTQGGRELSVPFIMVRSRNGDWLVEQIDTRALNARP
jgi:hypothetical protein